MITRSNQIEEWNLVIFNNMTDEINVYITKGMDSNPNEFNYDFLFKKIKANRNLILNNGALGLGKDDIEGFVIAVEVLGFDELNNTPK